MRATWAGRLAVAFVMLGFLSPGHTEEPARSSASTATSTPTSPETTPQADSVDIPKAQAELKQRLETLQTLQNTSPSAASKALLVVLEDRQALLKALEETTRSLEAAQNPKPSPESQEATWKAQLERLNIQLDQAKTDPKSILPSVFRKPVNDQVPQTHLAEMHDAIDDAKNDLKEWQVRLANCKSNTARGSSQSLAVLQAERDAIQQRVAALAPRLSEREGSLSDAKSESEQELANERLINLQWEARLENLRLATQEAKITLESKYIDLIGVEELLYDAQIRRASKALALMQELHQALNKQQQTQLKKAANLEKDRATRTEDPIDKFKSRAKAILLEMEVQALRFEKDLASSPAPSLEEQTKLADRAVNELENLKKMLDDNLVSQLDALRLNNDFRRIAPQRARIVNDDLKKSELLSTFYDNALTSIELEQLNDQRNDEYEQAALLEQLPKTRHDEAIAVFDDFDRQHQVLLARNRAVLEKLSRRAEQTHSQVLRRLRTLDDLYGFIRTHIFWLRDQEPLSVSTLAQANREAYLAGKALVKLARDLSTFRVWDRVSLEFIGGYVGMLLLVWPLVKLRRRLLEKSGEYLPSGSGVLVLKGLLVSVVYSAILPAYLILAAYTARQAPWLRSIAIPVSHSLMMLAPAAFVAGVVRWMLRPNGWAERTLRIPADVSLQLRRTVFALVAAGVPLLLPYWILGQGLLTVEGRPISAMALGRLLFLTFEFIVWSVVFRLARGKSPLVSWFLEFPSRFGWLTCRPRTVCVTLLTLIGGVIVMDMAGYSYSARRLSLGAGQFLVVLVICFCLYQMCRGLIDHHAWRWIRVGHAPVANTAPTDLTVPDDMAMQLRRLTGYLVPVLGVLMVAWIWDVDWAYFRFLGSQTLWNIDTSTPPILVSDFAKLLLSLVVTVAIWRNLNTIFALMIYPHMRDDPGVRFAVITLCRYTVLGIGVLSGLSAIHLGLEKIGVVLAALGVGLGFGLQEIVSNFVCGIILLLERPIRVDDVVTVAGMTGKVERINIRATTITNGDNQSIIVPNRAFITGDLVNWTLRDRVVRISIRVKVPHKSDPDRIADLLLTLARDDADVLRNPIPVAFMEDFSDSAMIFVMHAHVPDPSLAARVRHRLFSQIQRRFSSEGIAVPIPRHEIFLQAEGDTGAIVEGITTTSIDFSRLDPGRATPPGPHPQASQPQTPAQQAPPAVESCHRGVDD